MNRETELEIKIKIKQVEIEKMQLELKQLQQQIKQDDEDCAKPKYSLSKKQQHSLEARTALYDVLIAIYDNEEFTISSIKNNKKMVRSAYVGELYRRWKHVDRGFEFKDATLEDFIYQLRDSGWLTQPRYGVFKVLPLGDNTDERYSRLIETMLQASINNATSNKKCNR